MIVIQNGLLCILILRILTAEWERREGNDGRGTTGGERREGTTGGDDGRGTTGGERREGNHDPATTTPPQRLRHNDPATTTPRPRPRDHDPRTTTTPMTGRPREANNKGRGQRRRHGVGAAVPFVRSRRCAPVGMLPSFPSRCSPSVVNPNRRAARRSTTGRAGGERTAGPLRCADA